MPSTNPYLDLNLNPALFEKAILDLGATEYLFEAKGNCYHMSFVKPDGAPFKMEVFIKDNGSITLKKHPHHVDAFPLIADELIQKCKLSITENLSFSFKPAQPLDLALLRELLTVKGHIAGVEEPVPSGKKIVVKGSQGGRVTITVFDNRRVLFQGRPSVVAQDLSQVLAGLDGTKDAYKQHVQTFDIRFEPTELEGALYTQYPAMEGKLPAEIVGQLVASLTLSRVEMVITDYAYICFPALKALEGLILNYFVSIGLRPGTGGVGQYFEQPTGMPGKWKLTAISKPTHLSEEEAKCLEDCYTLYHNQRHSLFHMSSALVATRTIPSREEALTVLTKTFSSIETFCRKLK